MTSYVPYIAYKPNTEPPVQPTQQQFTPPYQVELQNPHINILEGYVKEKELTDLSHKLYKEISKKNKENDSTFYTRKYYKETKRLKTILIWILIILVILLIVLLIYTLFMLFKYFSNDKK